MRLPLAFMMLVLLAACATRAPDAIREPPPEDLSLAEVSRNPEAYQGRRVRWGGMVAAVENRPNETWIDVVARPLDGSGRPRAGDTSLGRFAARVQGFLDPAIYRQGREITVAGAVEGAVTRLIGQYPYRYVMVDADTTRLWEPEPRAYYRDPYYDPYYDPFWRSRFYPWHPWYGPGPFHPFWW
jgi:outer membrane lipoprotein